MSGMTNKVIKKIFFAISEQFIKKPNDTVFLVSPNGVTWLHIGSHGVGNYIAQESCIPPLQSDF